MTPSTRVTWMRMYEQTGDAGLTCPRCGVSRPTLRKWWRRYQADEVTGLRDRSRRPHHSPSHRRVIATQEDFIVLLRKRRQLVTKCLRNMLRRLWFQPPQASETGSQEVEALLTAKSGRRVQMDVCKLARRSTSAAP